jgi:riboflavin synthase
MFSGIVEEIGRVERTRQTSAGLALTIACQTVLEGSRLGDSIAVDGVCLTVAEMDGHGFTASIQPVTARLSTLGDKRSGSQVHLERSVAVGGRVGGHYVQGHIDAVGRVSGKRGEGTAVIVDISAPGDVLRYVVERGFIAVDGASLTVMTLRPDGLSVSLVYHTQQHITLAELPVGAPVNLEIDVFAKYVERFAAPYQSGGITLDTLRRAGFS